MKELEREILIIGAGPAGISAAIEAAKAGAKVTVADEHDTIGGQLYKQIHKFFGAADNHAGMRGFEIARKLEQEAKELGVEFWLSTVAYGIFKEGVGIVRDGGAVVFFDIGGSVGIVGGSRRGRGGRGRVETVA